VKDRGSMLAAFDLFDYGMSWSVPTASSVSCAAVRCPGDGAYPSPQVETLQPWIDAGKPA
jgi:hypothetical protein